MFATSCRPRAGDRRTASELVLLLAVGQISKARLGLSEGETACIIVIHFCSSRVCLEVYRPQSPDQCEIPAVRTRARRAVCRMELGNGRGAILLWVKNCVCSALLPYPLGQGTPSKPVDAWLATVCWWSICRMRVRASRLPGSMQARFLGRTAEEVIYSAAYIRYLRPIVYDFVISRLIRFS